jgi:membrane glycosyltransferase
VAQTLAGKSVSWNAQERADRGVTLREAFRRQKWHLVLGVVWGAAMLRLAPQFFWWLTPVLAGLVGGIGLTVWTSSISAGRRLRCWGLLLTPEETAPPAELVTFGQAYQQALAGPATVASTAAPNAAADTGQDYFAPQRKSG